MKHYKAHWSTLLIVLSSSLTVLCLGIGFSALKQGGGKSLWMGLPPLAFVLGCALFAIRGYTITSDSLLIHRLFWSTRLPLAGLQSAHSEPRAMRWSIRTFGNGGFFSFTGFYRNKLLGGYRAFVTDPRRTVVLHYPGRTIVVSPDAPEDFLRDLSVSTRADSPRQKIADL